MMTLKRTVQLGTFIILSCVGRDFAVAAPAYEAMDCRHLFAEDVRVSDQITLLRQKQSDAVSSGKDTADDGFFVKFDPIQGIGIMNGVTLSPEGKPLGDEVSDAAIEKQTKKQAAIKRQEVQKVCPTMTMPLSTQTRLKDDQMRVAP
ncbi:hypothetical protein AA0242T_0171 [Acetobacter aceti NRIC 0242]|uniref:Uncharacterized protein n=1 Tax=Acetobacter aceti NBRC 14818 TaxID=887700 RepID=A0AB33IE21_ACEAC|nr:hypothetical protein [Acetobacter aceti]TCS35379.1 hypothetical protein EDC15_101176 [Acetobacter aceti NBRC 14818]BCK75233.1 hypothetical protein EMQ_0839 [Acetobacter aceti NBRC 14818]GAN57477.1 hypothetical protein Abac_017_178 [Acetobacter aceti NBRC 14818]GBO79469.1 hypothetical protein AA0242T_0171 [Acetobacter aceti NRIC 0242]